MTDLYQASQPATGDAAPCSGSKSGAPSNPWNDFQHEHAGQGLSNSQMSDLYQASEPASSCASTWDDDDCGSYSTSTLDALQSELEQLARGGADGFVRVDMARCESRAA